MPLHNVYQSGDFPSLWKHGISWNNKNLSTKRKAFSKQFENEFKTELFFQYKKIINQCRFSGLIDPKTVEQRDRKFPSPKCGLAGPYNDTVRDFALVYWETYIFSSSIWYTFHGADRESTLLEILLRNNEYYKIPDIIEGCLRQCFLIFPANDHNKKY